MTTSTNARAILTQRAADRAPRRYLDARATGRRLAWSREAAGVTQAELAAYVGTSQATICRVEQARVRERRRERRGRRRQA
jgi:ribosome-binding protein aMBF1 (putative translation factor)